jgi:protease-4
VFNGRQALPLKLVDELGGEREAIAWLERERNVAKNLPVRQWRPRSDRSFDLWTAAASGARLFGFRDLASRLLQAASAAETARLDGLLAIWRPTAEP